MKLQQHLIEAKDHVPNADTLKPAIMRRKSTSPEKTNRPARSGPRTAGEAR